MAVVGKGGELQFFCSSKGKDADAFLKEQLLVLQPLRVFIE